MGRKLTSTLRLVMLTMFTVVLLIGGCTKEQETFVKKKFNLEEGEDNLAPLYSSNKSGLIPQSAYYVVVLQDNVDIDEVDFESDKITSFLSSQKDKTFKYAVKGFTIQLTAKDLKKVRKDPSVKYVEQDQVMKISATQFTAPWGLDRIDQQTAPLSGSYTYETTGSTVDAYIFDTGLKTDHNEFTGRVRAGFNGITAGALPVDDNGHGTHVAGVVGGTKYGVAKSINLIPVKVLDQFGTGTFTQIISGIDWAIANHTTRPAVGNVSISGDVSVALDEAIRRAITDGIVMSVAAGNNAVATSTTSPGRVTEAITVGAVTNIDQWSAFSNFGPEIDILAPGSSITSAWHTGINDINVVSGTSMATPHVTGAAALYLEKFPGSTPAQVQQGLKNFAAPNRIVQVPAATVNSLLQVNFNPAALPEIPVLASPVNNAANQLQALTLAWNASATSQSYDLQFSTRADFSSILLTLSGLNSTSQSISGLGFGATYYWRIRANNTGGSSNWSAPFAFTTVTRNASTLVAPQLVSPAQAATAQPQAVTLTWNSVVGASTYNVQFSSRPDFSTLLLNLTGRTATRQDISGLGSGATYYWRVAAVDASGAGPWSAANSFTTAVASALPGLPVLASPVSGATDQPQALTLTWNQVSGATSYNLQFSSSPTFATVILTLNRLTVTQQDISGLGSGATYYWRISANNASGSGAWSATASFTTAAAVSNQPGSRLLAPTLLLPADRATNVSRTPELTWSEVTGATAYHIQVSTSATFATTVADITDNTVGAITLSSPLASRTTHYWRVQPVNGAEVGPWSTARRFTTIR